MPHGATPIFEFWYEFASTYSYLAAMRIEEPAEEAGVDVLWRPFLLGPIFAAQGWDTSPFNIFPDKGRYMWRDMEREAPARACRSTARIRFRRTACSRPASRCSAPRRAGRRPSHKAVYHRGIRRRAAIFPIPPSSATS